MSNRRRQSAESPTERATQRIRVTSPVRAPPSPVESPTAFDFEEMEGAINEEPFSIDEILRHEYYGFNVPDMILSGKLSDNDIRVVSESEIAATSTEIWIAIIRRYKQDKTLKNNLKWIIHDLLELDNNIPFKFLVDSPDYDNDYKRAIISGFKATDFHAFKCLDVVIWLYIDNDQELTLFAFKYFRKMIDKSEEMTSEQKIFKFMIENL
jgi:hypothetical protein